MVALWVLNPSKAASPAIVPLIAHTRRFIVGCPLLSSELERLVMDMAPGHAALEQRRLGGCSHAWWAAEVHVVVAKVWDEPVQVAR